MALEIKIPSPGESISEVELTTWLVEDGSWVAKNQEIGEVESEKATLPLIATQGGQVKLLASEGETLEIGKVVATIDTSVPAPEGQTESDGPAEEAAESAPPAETKPAAGTKPAAERQPADKDKDKAAVESKPAPGHDKIKTTPLAREIMEQEGWSLDDVLKGLRRLGADDVKKAMSAPGSATGIPALPMEASRDEERSKMSQLRKKISQRLVAVKNETAMLTTFNEVDMSYVMGLRKQHQQAFTETHGIKLGFMSFFTRAVCIALKEFPNVNSRIEEEEVLSPAYCDVGIAVQTEKGLMVPVIRNAETMGLADLEKAIADLAARARKARLTIDEMSGGTFSISNGGIYGSMLSTPILNPPQSGILGMHNIVERPVAVEGKVEIRPMMYLALSYDHRIIDGKDSVGFLLRLKYLLEHPADLFTGRSAEELMLGI